MDFITGLVIGTLVFAAVWWFFFGAKKKKSNRNVQDAVVLQKLIKHVAKLVTVESYFSEILPHSDEKKLFFNLISSQKKLIIIAHAKVSAGFDMNKIKYTVDNRTKTFHITSFPEPEIFSIEVHPEYYDLKSGLFNKFKPGDHTELHKKSREHIKTKAYESGLIDEAREKVDEAIDMLDETFRALGWHISWDALPDNIKLTENETKKLESGKVR